MKIEDIDIPDKIKVIFFDMDHTIINNDCDVSWKNFLKKKKLVGIWDALESRWHYLMYRLGKLNQEKFFDFQLKEFRQKTYEEMAALLADHFEEFVKPRIYKIIPDLVSKLKRKGIPRILLTATSEEIARPLADHLDMDGLIGTRLEVRDNRYTGKINGPWCGGENKVLFIKSHLKRKKINISEVSYWGDNITDSLVLEAVGFPMACNPTPALKKISEERGWPVIELK